MGVAGLLAGLYQFISGEHGNGYIFSGLGLLFILFGVILMGMTTKVTFNQPDGYITVTRGHIPIFLWFLRKRLISKEEGKSVYVDYVYRTTNQYGGQIKFYQTKVVTKLGKRITLFEDTRRDKADYLARRILQFFKL